MYHSICWHIPLIYFCAVLYLTWPKSILNVKAECLLIISFSFIHGASSFLIDQHSAWAAFPSTFWLRWTSSPYGFLCCHQKVRRCNLEHWGVASLWGETWPLGKRGWKESGTQIPSLFFLFPMDSSEACFLLARPIDRFRVPSNMTRQPVTPLCGSSLSRNQRGNTSQHTGFTFPCLASFFLSPSPLGLAITKRC